MTTIFCVIFSYLIIGFTIAYFAMDHMDKSDKFFKRWEDCCKDAADALNIPEDQADTFGIVAFYLLTAVTWGYMVPKVIIELIIERRK